MSTSKQLLIVDDDQEIRELLNEYLTRAGFQVLTAAEGNEMRQQLAQHSPDLIILDIMMPGEDGFTLCQQIRRDSQVPIIMLTAASDEADRVIGLELGADDYIAKPFSPRELQARIKALLRRARIVDEHKITIGDVELDYDTHTVRRGHDAQVLPPKEFNLLYKLLAYPERTFTRLELLDEIWGMDSESDDKTVNVHINRLRTRFYDWPEFEIQTIRGIGYRAIKKV